MKSFEEYLKLSGESTTGIYSNCKMIPKNPGRLADIISSYIFIEQD